MAENPHDGTKRARVLVDDEPSMAETLADGLVDRGYTASAIAVSRHGREYLRA